MPQFSSSLPKDGYLSAMRGGSANFEFRQFRVKISQSLIENQPVSRILAASHLI